MLSLPSAPATPGGEVESEEKIEVEVSAVIAGATASARAAASLVPFKMTAALPVAAAIVPSSPHASRLEPQPVGWAYRAAGPLREREGVGGGRRRGRATAAACCCGDDDESSSC